MRRLLIFVKYPAPGRVKTRLAVHLSEAAVTEIYRACAELTLYRLRAFQQEIVLCVEPPGAIEAVREWLGTAWAFHPQQGVTLGERLQEAVAYVFAQTARRVVVIGTDSPWLAQADLDAAFGALDGAEMTIGPTDDGGYYLIGLSKPAPALFAQIPWSSSRVYEETLARARALGLRAHALRRGYDVDRLEDLHRFIAEETAGGTTSTHVKLIEALSRQLVHSP